MRVRPCPVKFFDGGTLSPRDLNENFDHLARTIGDIQEKRFCHSVLRFPFHKSPTAPYTQSLGIDVRSYRLRFDIRFTIERAYFRYFGNASSGDTEVRIRLGDLQFNPLPGTRNPYLSVKPGTQDREVADFNGERVVLYPNTTYTLLMETDPGDAFTSKHSFVELHLRSDRGNTAGIEHFAPYVPRRFSASDACDASVINAEFQKVSNAVSILTNNARFPRAELYVMHDISPSMSVSLARWKIPQANSDETSRKLDDVYFAIARSTPPSATITSTAILYDQSGSSSFYISLSLNTTQTFRDEYKLLSTRYIQSSGANPSDPSQDWWFELDNLGSYNIEKAYALFLYE